MDFTEYQKTAIKLFCQELKDRWVKACKQNPDVPLDQLFLEQFIKIEKELETS